ncbi:SH3 domain-containing protein [Neobacillus drentensis]|uniref:SH3 domain-containing protein n=1 Tax=Neobacillus drentensis TaxID=220684 RepID=UPI002FFF55E5
MNQSKKIIAVCTLTIGIVAGATIFTPTGMNAAGNVVLASVDWVNTKINPINTKLSSLESKIASLEAKVTSQQQEINNLKAGNGGSTGIHSVVYVNKSYATVHSGASRVYKVVATKSKGTSLTVIDSFNSQTGIWYRVSLSSTLKGWIYSGDISTSKVTNTNPSQVVTTGIVYLRKGASPGYASIETIQKGVTLKYIQSFTNDQGQTWYNVETSSGKRGWISSSLGEVK